jgi:glycosyltransferase involved in cell wall biosynthesis
MALLKADEVVFGVLSFEGPDPYAQAGGLAVRVTQLTEALAQRGFTVHLFFIGDPEAPGQEARLDGRLILQRWCQWISRHHPLGVYDGEEGKRRDFTATTPLYLLEQVIRPALEAGRLPVILAEEWHTAEAVIHLDELLRARGWRERCVILWNANNTMSFHRIDWQRLSAAAQLLTVSRYMKHQMWKLGVNPLVIPNGIPSALLEPVPRERISALHQALGVDERTVMLFKVGRFDPAKRWLLAVEAAARLKAMGYRVVFPLRGGIEPHGREVFERAGALGLRTTHLAERPAGWEELLEVLRAQSPAELYALEFPLPQDWLRPFYAAADAVLAISGHEPFGLAGLEAMAAGGIVFTGATGEEYALDGQAAVVLYRSAGGDRPPVAGSAGGTGPRGGPPSGRPSASGGFHMAARPGDLPGEDLRRRPSPGGASVAATGLPTTERPGAGCGGLHGGPSAPPAASARPAPSARILRRALGSGAVR